jgi:hypothetical protein
LHFYKLVVYYGNMSKENFREENEPKSEDEFMHKPGEIFVAQGEAHILSGIGLGFTPADSECEEYVATCGVESQSWSMPSQGVGMAEFVTKEEAQKGRIEKCRTCFGITAEKPAETPQNKQFQVFVKGSPVIINGIIYTEETNPVNEKENLKDHTQTDEDEEDLYANYQ